MKLCLSERAFKEPKNDGLFVKIGQLVMRKFIKNQKKLCRKSKATAIKCIGKDDKSNDKVK